MPGFGLGITCSLSFPGLLGEVFRPVWKVLVTRTGVAIEGRPAVPTFSVSNVSADGATIKRG